MTEITLADLGGTAQLDTDTDILADDHAAFMADTGSVQQGAHYVNPSSSGKTGTTTTVEDRAMVLLGQGVGGDQVASALGVQPSRISQLLSDEVFSKRVSELRYKNLQERSVRDGKYDGLEDKLLAKLDKALPLMVKPRDIIDALTKVNGAKRRGQSAPQQVTNQQNIVNLVMPKVIQDKFAVNLDNQVIRAGQQELLTMPSGNLLKQVEAAEAARIGETSNEHTESTSNL